MWANYNIGLKKKFKKEEKIMKLFVHNDEY